MRGLIAALVAMTMLGFGKVEATASAVEPETSCGSSIWPSPALAAEVAAAGLKQLTKPPKAERKGSEHTR